MEKVRKIMVFGEGTKLTEVLNALYKLGIIDDLCGYPNEIVETATGKVIMKAPCIEGKTYPMIWDALAKTLGLTTIGKPEYENYLFAFEGEKS